LVQKYHKKRKKFFKNLLSGKVSKSLSLTFFLAEKTDPNYDTVDNTPLRLAIA
jgi:hypothetical protein